MKVTTNTNVLTVIIHYQMLYRERMCVISTVVSVSEIQITWEPGVELDRIILKRAVQLV